MRRFARENGLSLAFGALFVLTLVAQSIAGVRKENGERDASLTWWEYVRSPDFGGAVMENWQSEFLQFSLFIGATIWLVQKGSNESKRLEDVGLESDEKQLVGRYAPPGAPRWATTGGIRTRLYENSLLIVMTLIFLGTWFGQSLNNWRSFNEERLEQGGATVSFGRYWLDPDLWEKTLQNWQSEFLAIGAIVVFSIYLRQRGSPESKPVGSPHDDTAASG